jgi:GT2 family glycosyltransferase
MDAVMRDKLDGARPDIDLTCVINVRNGERYLRQTLLSIFRSRPGAKVLVVDNHSSDGTAEILGQFPEVRTILTPAPCSLGAARNFALDFVSTAYMTWLDADDQWLPDFHSCYAKAARLFPDAVMISSGSIIIDEQGTWLPSRRQRFLARELKDHLEVGDTLERFMKRIGFRDAWCSYVFKTESVRKVGGVDVAFEFAEDVDLIGKLLTEGSGVHIPRNLTLLRYHPQQITRRLPPGKRSEEIMLALKNAASRSGEAHLEELTTAESVLELKSTIQEFVAEPISGHRFTRLLCSMISLRTIKWFCNPSYLKFCTEQMGLLGRSRTVILEQSRLKNG